MSLLSQKRTRLEQCVTFRRIFNRKLQDGEIIFKMKEIATFMSDLPLTMAKIKEKYRR